MASIFDYNPENIPFKSPTDGITLMAGKPNKGSEGLDNNLCSLLEESGMNAASALITQDQINPSLNNCLQHGIKLFIRNYNMLHENTLNGFVKSFKDSPALGGWFLETNIDSPTLGDWNKVYDIYKGILDQDSQHPIFIGLPGDLRYYRTYNSKGEIEYRKKVVIPDTLDPFEYKEMVEYIADFQDVFQPSFWPYVFFPDIEPMGSSTLQETDLEERKILFYKDLQYFAYVARYTERPFWTFVRCQGISALHGFSSPAPILAMIKGLVFSSLAYGAQGIYYWNFRAESDRYFDAPISYDGAIDQSIVNILKRVNAEVRAFNNVFYGCEYIDSRHLTSLGESDARKLMYNPMGPLLSVKLRTSTRKDIILSHVFNNNTNYLIVVGSFWEAYSYQYNQRTRYYYQFEFSPYWEVTQLKYTEDGVVEEPLENYEPGFFITPGDYLIFKWK